MLPKYNARVLPLFASTIATPVFRSEASMARTRMDLISDQTEHQENATDRTEKQTHNPKSSLLCQRRNRGDGNGDLKHGHAARKNFMLMKVRLCLRFFCFRFFLDVLLLFFVARGLFAIFLIRCGCQGHL